MRGRKGGVRRGQNTAPCFILHTCNFWRRFSFWNSFPHASGRANEEGATTKATHLKINLAQGALLGIPPLGFFLAGHPLLLRDGHALLVLSWVACVRRDSRGDFVSADVPRMAHTLFWPLLLCEASLPFRRRRWMMSQCTFFPNYFQRHALEALGMARQALYQRARVSMVRHFTTGRCHFTVGRNGSVSAAHRSSAACHQKRRPVEISAPPTVDPPRAPGGSSPPVKFSSSSSNKP